MRKLQQLLFLGPVEGRLGGQEGGGTDVLQVGQESKSRSLRGGWRRRGPRGPMEPGASEQTCSRGGGSYLTVHNGLLFLQLDLFLSCLSTQQSLEDRPFRKATLLLQGHLTIWGQSTGKVVSIEEAVTTVPRLVGGGHGPYAGTGSPTLSQQGHKDSTSGPGSVPRT